MKVSEYKPLYNLMFNFEYKTAIDGKSLSLNEMFDSYPDFELTEIHLDQFYYFDLFSFQKVIKDTYFNENNIIPYLREILDNYREDNGDPLFWLNETLKSVHNNPNNYRKDLISVIEIQLVKWIEHFEKFNFQNKNDEDKPKKTLNDYFRNIKDLDNFIENLKKAFPTEKGKTFKAIFNKLNDNEILLIPDREFSKFLKLFKKAFDRDIGEYQSINDVKNIDTEFYTKIEQKLKPLINKHKQPN